MKTTQNQLPQPASLPGPAPTKKATQKKSESSKKTDFAKYLEEADRPRPNRPAKNKTPKKIVRNDNAHHKQAVRKNKSPLAQLGKVIGKGKKAIEKSDALAFMTGHLEKIAPQSIPDLISGNQFISEAMGDDIPSFMQQPDTVANIISKLDLPNNISQAIKAEGIDENLEITPIAFFKAIKIDPQKIVAELTKLKSISLMEGGVDNYIKLASKLQGNTRATPAPTDLREVAENLNKNVKQKKKQVQEALEQAGQIAQPVPVLPITEADTKAPKQEITNSSDIINNNAPSHNQNTHGFTQQQVTQKPNGQTFAQQIDVTEPLSSSTLDPMHTAKEVEAMDMDSPMNETSNLTVNETTKTVKPIGPQTTNLDNIEVVDINPFEAQKTLMQPQSIKQKNFTTAEAGSPDDTQPLFLNSKSLDEQLVRARFSTTDNTQQQNIKNISLAQVDPKPATRKEESAKELLIEDRPDLPLSEELAATATHQVNKRNNGTTVKHKLMSEVNSIESSIDLALAEAQPDPGEDLDQEPSGEQDTKPNEQPKEVRNKNQAPIHHLGNNFQESLVDSNNSKIQDLKDGNEFLEKIQNKIKMMTKDNKSSAVIDLSSKESGQLSLAIQVDNDKVNLRIISSSDRVRSMLNADMLKLQEALSHQNLRLNDVELGTSHGGESLTGQNPWAGFNDQGFTDSGGFNGQQEAQNAIKQINKSVDNMTKTQARTISQLRNESSKISVLA